jgi:hypothetical protein
VGAFNRGIPCGAAEEISRARVGVWKHPVRHLGLVVEAAFAECIVSIADRRGSKKQSQYPKPKEIENEIKWPDTVISYFCGSTLNL